MQNSNHIYFCAAFGKDHFKYIKSVCATMATQTEV